MTGEGALALARRYGPGERLLHRLALGSPGAIALADRVDAMLGAPEPDPRPVFVAGLARSGTTLVLELLAASGAFTSLTYRAMPFVTAPLLWGRIAGRRTGAGTAERAHGDGMAVGLESPEALEEVFWRGRLGDRQMGPDRIRMVEPSPQDIAAFRAFVGRVLAADRAGTRDTRRYLSKNTVTLTRLGAVARAFPEARILVPVREPESFAASVLAQHDRFREVHREDAFTRSYMDWLGHTEFGSGFRPLGLPGVTPPEGGPEGLTRDWLIGYWVAVHRWFLEAPPVPLAFVSLAHLREAPGPALERLARAAGVVPEALPRDRVKAGAPSPPPPKGCSAEAAELYAEIDALAREAPPGASTATPSD